MMETLKFNLKEKNASESISSITDSIQQLLEQMEVSMAVSSKISICCDEILSNVVYYSEADILEITFENSEKGISVTFSDNGKAFNPLEKKDPDITLNAEERQIGGLGIFMVKKMMSSVDYLYENSKNVLKMTMNY